MKKNNFHVRSTNNLEKTASFYQPSNPFLAEKLAQFRSTQYFFGIEEENARKLEMLRRIVEENA